MQIAETIQSLHKKHRAAAELEDTPIPGFTSDELGQLEAACGHPLPKQLQAALKTAGVFESSPEVFLEDVGYFVLSPPQTMIADAENLRKAAEEGDWTLPPCCSLSLLNNEFIAYDFEKGTVLSINGDDGEVNDLGFGLEELLTKCAELWEKQLEG